MHLGGSSACIILKTSPNWDRSPVQTTTPTPLPWMTSVPWKATLFMSFTSSRPAFDAILIWHPDYYCNFVREVVWIPQSKTYFAISFQNADMGEVVIPCQNFACVT